MYIYIDITNGDRWSAKTGKQNTLATVTVTVTKLLIPKVFRRHTLTRLHTHTHTHTHTHPLSHLIRGFRNKYHQSPLGRINTSGIE